MATRKIITVDQDEEFLRKTSKPVEKFDESLHLLLADMWDTLKKYNGAGLSAVQIGVLKRVFITATDGKKEYINPTILETSKRQKKCTEGCLSVPKKYDKVMRPVWVTVRAQDRNGNLFTETVKGYSAQAVCHESDHLDGKLYIDIALGEGVDK